MPIITISRGSFSGGKKLAECLSRRLGFRTIDRDVIVQRAATYGVSGQELQEALEKPPSFLERFQHKRYRYLAILQAALAEEVCPGKVIYHGHAGHLLLKGGSPVLRVRVIAPLEMRIQMAQERLNVGRNEALAYIKKVDEQRRRWTQFLYGVDWTDASLYDLVINLEHIDIPHACQIVADAVKGQKCFEYDEKCRDRMRDFLVASKVKASLAVNDATADLEVDVDCKNGVVAISGRIPRVELAPEVERIAMSVPGVTKVDLSNLTPPVPD